MSTAAQSSRGMARRMTDPLAIAGLLPETVVTSLPAAEADVLADITFGGSPLRVYLAFTAVPDGGGEALLVIALYDDRRVEVRVLRGGTKPLYGIFALAESGSIRRVIEGENVGTEINDVG